MNFAKSKWCFASLEFVGMVGRVTGGVQASSDSRAYPPPTTVEELRAFLGITGDLR